VTVKKIYWILIAAALIAVVAAPGVALANNGPHGSYIMNTDACAGCHRAHTAPSSITWVDSQDQVKSALLLTDASEVYLFCLTCHDSTSQGADTNVLDGVYEGTAYGTQNAAMISGAFGREDVGGSGPGLYDGSGHRVTSTHTMNGQSWGAWGGGSFGATKTIDATGNYPSLLGTGTKIVMDCGSCHDPHGSSNYRILKDVVNGVPVGGYTGTDPENLTPTPFVLSSEQGFPTGGFLLHVPAAGYKPNYTVAQYSKGPGTGAEQASKGMVGWCISCHTVYASLESTYNAGDGFGFVDRHRHPMNVSLDKYFGPRPLTTPSAITLPLAHDFGEITNESTDFVECLTCHNAHGASTIMTGFANVANQLDPVADSGSTFGGGVDPTTDSALLKLNNRGVCEECHNK
jgi:cytochrome c553